VGGLVHPHRALSLRQLNLFVRFVMK